MPSGMKNVVQVARASRGKELKRSKTAEETLKEFREADIPGLPNKTETSTRSIESITSMNEVSERLTRDISKDSEELKKLRRKNGLEERILNSTAFNAVVYTAILLNAVQMGFATDYPEFETLWLVTDNFFTALFTVEMLIKLAILGVRGYGKDSWNLLDCFLVSMSILDGWILYFIVQSGGDSPLGSISVLRVLRVIRMARLLKVFKELWMIIKGILDSLRTMFWVTMLLLLILYVCSILTTRMIGHQGIETYPGHSKLKEDILESEMVTEFNNYMYFGSISRAMYTLFCVVIMAEWPELGRPIVEQQPEMLIFFAFFIIFTTFGVMNVIIGVIVDNTMEAARAMQEDDMKKERVKKLRNLEMIRQAVFNMDEDANGVIDLEELEKGFKMQEVQDALKLASLPKAFNHEELMNLLDHDADGMLREGEFMLSFFRLIESDSFQRNCQMHAGMNDLKRHLKVQEELLDAEFEQMSRRLTGLERSLYQHADEVRQVSSSRQVSGSSGSSGSSGD